MKTISVMLLAVLLLGTPMFTGCKKIEPPRGVVLVVDQDDNPVWDAKVLLHAYDVPPPARPGDSVVVREGVTDVNGRFSFEVPNPCVLTIDASAEANLIDPVTGDPYRDTIFGTASIRLENDETSEQKVILRP